MPPPPWVQFDSAASSDWDCNKASDPDIAGVGVVISFVLASIMTTSASILAMMLDAAFDSKGQFSPRAPFKYFRERFVDTEWKKDYAWRPFLDPLIIGLADQQLVTGYAVLLSGWIKVLQNSFEVHGAHFSLILYICSLSSSSHLAALITLRRYFRKYRLIAKIRVTLVVVFALFLLGSFLAAIAIPDTVTSKNKETEAIEDQSRMHRYSFLVPMLFIIFGFSTALVCVLYRPKPTGLPHQSSNAPKKHSSSDKLPRKPTRMACLTLRFGFRLLCNLFLNPLITFTIQILLAILSVVLVLSQKFATPDDAKDWCGLHHAGENVWGFGQTLSVVMLSLPVMSATQTFLEGRQHIREGNWNVRRL